MKQNILMSKLLTSIYREQKVASRKQSYSKLNTLVDKLNNCVAKMQHSR